METRDIENVIFELIMHAGNAKSKAMEAIYASRKGDLAEADILLKEGKEELILAHKSQTNMVFDEAKGNNVHVNILLVHALDHLAMATMSCEIGEEFVLLRKEMRGES